MKKLKYVLGILLAKILPVKKNRIVFTSYAGHYNDSPKYIFDAMYKLNHNLDYIWLVNKKNIPNVPRFAKTIEYGTIKSFYYYGTSRIIVDNVHGYKLVKLLDNSFFSKIIYKIKIFLCRKSKQYLYTTWHGTPLKKMDRDQVGSKIIDFTCQNTTFLLGDEHTLKILDNIHFNKVKCELIGCARNDILHSNLSKIEEIKRKLNLPLNKKIILFAPTFRTGDSEKDKDIKRSGINQLNEIDFDRLFKTLNEKFGNDWVFIGRFHYHVEKLINWEDLLNKYGDKIINGNNGDDMAEYLACTDILVTYASSCMFDFMITKKPVFLFFPDFDHYSKIERGLYYPIEKLPFPFSKDFDELIQNIKNFNNDKYGKGVEKLEKEFNVIIDKNSSKKIAEYILKENDLL